MKKTCFIDGCSKSIGFICLCNMTSMCLDHVGQHQIISNTHKYIQISRTPDKDSFNKVIESLIIFQNSCRLMKSKVIDESKMLIQEIYKQSNSMLLILTSLEAKTQEFIKSIINQNTSNSLIEDYLHSLLVSSSEAINKEIQEN